MIPTIPNGKQQHTVQAIAKTILLSGLGGIGVETCCSKWFCSIILTDRPFISYFLMVQSGLFRCA